MAKSTKGTKNKGCDDSSCLHVNAPKLDDRQAPLDVLEVDEDDETLSLEGRRIVGVERRDLEAPISTLIDCSFQRCDLANIGWKGSRLQRVAFVDCRLVGVDFTEEASLEDVTFTGCTLDMATFDTASLRRVVFTNCRLDGAAFGGTKLEGVAFPESDLARCDLSGARGEGGPGAIDLRDALLAGASFDARLLRVLTIHPEDAATIVAALGVTVAGGRARTSCKS